MGRVQKKYSKHKSTARNICRDRHLDTQLKIRLELFRMASTHAWLWNLDSRNKDQEKL